MAAEVWSAPEPPPGSVTAVRDRYGVPWTRDPGDPVRWWGNIGHDYDQHRTWWELLARGPLNDASGDVVR
jgi:hypothetical protein